MSNHTPRAEQAQNIFSVVPSSNGFRIRKTKADGQSKISKAIYADPVDAADHACRLASFEHGHVSLDGYLLEQVVAFYQIEGAACFAGSAKRYVEPWNQFMRQGYEAARLKAQGSFFHGWPQIAQVAA